LICLDVKSNEQMVIGQRITMMLVLWSKVK